MLFRSNEETAWEEIMKIKELPIPMAKKREEKAKIMVRSRFIAFSVWTIA